MPCGEKKQPALLGPQEEAPLNTHINRLAKFLMPVKPGGILSYSKMTFYPLKFFRKHQANVTLKTKQKKPYSMSGNRENKNTTKSTPQRTLCSESGAAG